MKKVLFATLFAACASIGLSSCMNGDYDANPNGTNSGPNPLAQNNNGGSGGGGGGNNNNPGTAQKGEVRLNANGTNYTFKTSVNWNTLLGGRSVVGGTISGNNDLGTLLQMDNYTGPATYTIVNSGEVRASFRNNDLVGMSTKTYHTKDGSPQGTGQIVVTSDANDEMIGTFNFEAYTNTGEKMTVTNGSFHVVKM